MTSPLRVGVLLCGSVQLLDLAAVDLLGMVTPEYLRLCKLPDQLLSLGQPIEFVYIGEGKKAGEVLETTASVKVVMTHSIDTAGHLDILVVPGPDPAYKPSPEVVNFLQSTVPKLSALLVICSGILPVTFSGVLEGKKVTAPRPFLPALAKKFPNATWTDFRWEKDVHQKEDGKTLEVWTSGGVTNGTDMIAAYVKEKYPPPLASFVCLGADVGDRAREYSGPALEIPFSL